MTSQIHWPHPPSPWLHLWTTPKQKSWHLSNSFTVLSWLPLKYVTWKQKKHQWKSCGIMFSTTNWEENINRPNRRMCDVEIMNHCNTQFLYRLDADCLLITFIQHTICSKFDLSYKFWLLWKDSPSYMASIWCCIWLGLFWGSSEFG